MKPDHIDNLLGLARSPDPVGHVAVEVRKLTRPGIAWLNRRWFIEQGVDLEVEGVEDAVEQRLLEAFGWCVPTDDVPFDALTADVGAFHADRYGGGGLESHGGSGRAATRGDVQVKGVGPTPLVGQVAEHDYSHGCVWLEEAIREAVFAELVEAEFPLGAVPVLAVIDCGFAQGPDVGSRQRRALVLRPAVRRLCHLQRAALFREDGDTETFSAAGDVSSVRAAFAELSPEADEKALFQTVSALVARAAEQMAEGRALRLFSGGPYSSNFAWSGRLIDFGSFTALHDWSSVSMNTHAAVFGDELRQLQRAALSLARNADRHASSSSRTSPSAAVGVNLPAIWARSELNAWMRLTGLHESDPAVAASLAEIIASVFADQQRNRISYADGARSALSCPFAEMSSWHEATAAKAKHPVLAQVMAQLQSAKIPQGRKAAAWSELRRRLRPRPLMDRTELQTRIYEAVGPAASAPDPTTVAHVVNQVLSLSRRHWPDLPAGLIVLAARFDGSTTMLSCLDVNEGRRYRLQRALEPESEPAAGGGAQRDAPTNRYIWTRTPCTEDENLPTGWSAMTDVVVFESAEDWAGLQGHREPPLEGFTECLTPAA